MCKLSIKLMSKNVNYKILICFNILKLLQKAAPWKGNKLSDHILETSMLNNVPESLTVLNLYQSKAYKIFYKMKNLDWF